MYFHSVFQKLRRWRKDPKDPLHEGEGIRSSGRTSPIPVSQTPAQDPESVQQQTLPRGRRHRPLSRKLRAAASEEDGLPQNRRQGGGFRWNEPQNPMPSQEQLHHGSMV
uniref:Uncharacterized protein n=1 Tax=Araneus ventricosus TaxID=182803 RepID=A0A4Y2V7E6_ARAVE|nr:hypothetical protein AVEN_124506-1 [Araneus ventricosus]